MQHGVMWMQQVLSWLPFWTTATWFIEKFAKYRKISRFWEHMLLHLLERNPIFLQMLKKWNFLSWLTKFVHLSISSRNYSACARMLSSVLSSSIHGSSSAREEDVRSKCSFMWHYICAVFKTTKKKNSPCSSPEICRPENCKTNSSAQPGNNGIARFAAL